jgi:two-component system chemotaxis response regulator CheB
MPKARVLIVDDSTVIRRLLTDALAGDPAIEVAATAANGRIALAKLPQVNPDLVTLDLEMPEMDGLETLAEIRRTHPRLPVIMFSTLTQRGAVATLNALAQGASDYVTKPANVGSVTAAIQSVQSELIPKIKALCKLPDGPHVPLRVAVPRSASPNPGQTAPAQPPRRTALFARHPVEVIAIGVSTGGPNALTEIFRQLPGDLPVPIVIVQHMPPLFTRYLADRLATVSPVAVREAAAGDVLTPGGAWLAPGGWHMALTETAGQVRVKLHQGPLENSCRPAVDVLFRSVAERYGAGALALVLTGMGQDGLRGCEAIAAAGGRILIQDEASSVIWGMPGAVAHAGLADKTLPLHAVAPELTRLARHSGPRSAPLATTQHA